MAEPAPAAPPTPTSTWDTILTSTPVLLAVVSTLLAGQSSTEMSLAQYHRALASQQQAKAGDQWNFFQAKRIRGTQYESSADQLFAGSVPSPVTAARMRESADLLAEAAGKLESAPAADARKAAADLAAVIGGDKEADAALARLNGPYPQLKGGKFEPDLGIELLPLRDEALNRIAKAISERKTEAETLEDVAGTTQAAIDAATDAAERNAGAFDAWGRKAIAPVGPFDEWVRRSARAAAGLARALQDSRESAEAAGDAKAAADLSGPLRKAEAAHRRSHRLLHDMFYARASFTAWRYSVEAGFNQRSASLFEVQVRRSSWESGVHIKRSWGYFYGQLAVQAAVTVATLALALRNRSGVWILACVASLGGLAYAIGVFLNKVPVPGVAE